MPLFSFYTPWKHKKKVFWRFQKMQKETIGMEWVYGHVIDHYPEQVNTTAK